MELHVESETPSSESVHLTDTPFQFRIGGIKLIIKPLSLFDLELLNKNIDAATLKLCYQGYNEETLALLYAMELTGKKEVGYFINTKEFRELKEKLDRTKNITKIIVDLIEPVNYLSVLFAIVRYNLKYVFNRRKWVFNLEQLLYKAINHKQLYDCISYLVRYNSEVKKNLLTLHQKGITSITKSRNPSSEKGTGDLYDSEWQQGWVSLGEEMLAFQKP